MAHRRLACLRSPVLLSSAALFTALAGATAIYFPALQSGFFSDDYVYLHAATAMSHGDYLRAAFDPTVRDSPVQVAGDYWRPAAVMSWAVMQPLFGDNPLPYHLVNLAIHACGVVLICLLAGELTGRREAQAVAAIVFAVHPAGHESISWISANNSAALPLALGAWLAFARAAAPRRGVAPATARLQAGGMTLMAIALLFRETAVVVLVAMVVWFVLVRRPERNRHGLRAHAPLLPYAILAAIYLAVASAGFTQSLGRGHTSLKPGDIEHAWYLFRQAAIPVDHPANTALAWVQRAAAVCLLAALPVAVALRRWLDASLLVGFFLSLVPYSLFNLSLSPRLFYFPAALFALAMGAAAAEFVDVRLRLPREVRQQALAVACVAVTIAACVTGNRRVERWVEQGPDVYNAWLDELRATYPELPAGGTLFVANTPGVLAIFDGFTLPSALSYRYGPNSPARVIVIQEADIPKVRFITGEADRIFVYNGP